MFGEPPAFLRDQRTPPSAPTDDLAITNVSRRGFVGGASALVIGVSLAACSREEPVSPPTNEVPEVEDETAQAGPPEYPDVVPALFIAITPDNLVKITCARSEMGQQTWTSMTQIVADELEADWDSIEVVQAIGHPRYGDQNTDGSTSVRNQMQRLRQTGAAMRQMLEQAAADAWGVDVSECRGEQNEVIHAASGQRATYGSLAEAAGKLPVPAKEDIRLKDRSEWRYIGTDTPSVTVPKIVRGEGTFGIDVQLPDMVHAVVAHPPQLFGKPGQINDSDTLKTPGVIRTIRLPDPQAPAAFQPLGGVAVIASDTWAAIQGRNALDVEWLDGPNKDYKSERFADEMAETARQPGAVGRNRGDVDAALENADQRVVAEYYAAHLSQSPMEPPSATAHWDGDTVECWACTQNPQAARSTVAAVCGVPEDNVTVHTTWLGGGFGRKSKPDYVAEAALLAREMGKPVKVTWTREDDLMHGYFHSVSAQRLEGGLDADGKCVAFLHRTVFPTIGSTFAPGADEPSSGELGLGASDNPFDVGNIRLEGGKAAAHIRIGWLRSVSNVYHAFAVQSFAAELAAAAGRDQKDYLLELFGPPQHVNPNAEGAEYANYGASLEDYPIDTARLANVTRKAAEMAGWGRDLPAGRGLGIATHRSFLTYVSTVVEVAVDSDGALTIPGVWSAMDAGTVVNTRHATAQLEGGTLYGLSNALYGQITADGGVVQQTNFPAWRLMRINEAPRNFETHLVDSAALPGGIGEPPTPPAAPALANAIFNATGVRMRRMPFLGDDYTLNLSDNQDA